MSDDDEDGGCCGSGGGSGGEKDPKKRPACACAPTPDGTDPAFDELARNLQAQVDAMESEYFSPVVIRECKYPRNVGRMENPDASGKHGTAGESMELHLRFDGEGKVAEALFSTDGCGSTIACGSMLTQMVKGKGREELEKITADELSEALEGLPPAQMHCAELAVDTLKAALKK